MEQQWEGTDINKTEHVGEKNQRNEMLRGERLTTEWFVMLKVTKSQVAYRTKAIIWNFMLVYGIRGSLGNKCSQTEVVKTESQRENWMRGTEQDTMNLDSEF